MTFLGLPNGASEPFSLFTYISYLSVLWDIKLLSHTKAKTLQRKAPFLSELTDLPNGNTKVAICFCLITRSLIEEK